MTEFPEFLRFELALYVDHTVSWLTLNFKVVFDAVKLFLLGLMLRVEKGLLWLPWWVVVVLVAGLGWKATGRWIIGLMMGTGLVLIGSLGLWYQMMQTLAIVGAAVIVSLALGIPTGIFIARNTTAESVVKPALDAMQTLPSFVYLIPAMMFFGLGKVPALFATIIYAIPPIIRLTNLGIRQVPADVVEAGRAFGSTPLQLLLKIQIPLARPAIMSGINQTTMMALAMVVIASMIGARGLGEPVLMALGRGEVGRGFEAGLAIVLLAIIVDRILQGIGRQRQDLSQ